MRAGALIRGVSLLTLVFLATHALCSDWRRQCRPWQGTDEDLAVVLADLGNAHTVMIGESTHGTHEFLVERARLSQALVEHAHFEAILIEAPWAPLLAADDYVRNAPLAPPSARDVVAKVTGFPRWVVQTPPFLDFLEALRQRPKPPRVFGFDLYSLPESAQALIEAWRALGREDEAERAEKDLACFFRYRPEPMLYGWDVETRAAPPCGAGARRQLALLRLELGDREDEAAFRLRLHAETVVAAEAYYRAIYQAGVSSWNVRERHLFAVIEAVRAHLVAQGGQGKVIVWAHNTHVGDARATDMGKAGELSLGQLARERHGAENVFLLGMTTRTGTVRAADGWGRPDRVKRLLPARRHSLSALFGSAKLPAFYLRLRANPVVSAQFGRPLAERAIGVVYSPRQEWRDHYYFANPSEQFDAMLHLDKTQALRVLPLSDTTQAAP
ncbi:MAG: erythromycin esterase family protein [Rhodocyclaceae bacterium]|nr:erythromycin esterase family protein [Rhodocyclaceae bacterium]